VVKWGSEGSGKRRPRPTKPIRTKHYEWTHARQKQKLMERSRGSRKNDGQEKKKGTVKTPIPIGMQEKDIRGRRERRS